MTAPRTILVDLRGTQFNGDRGIPAYAQSLTLELIRGQPAHHWLLLHDARRPLPARAGELAAHAAWCTVADLEARRAPSADVVLTGCFFLPHHACGGDYLLPPAVVASRPRRLGIVYDLVPLLFADRYLARDRARHQYLECVRVMRQSDALFAISRATRRDTIRHAAVDPARVRCIYGDIDQAKRELMARPAAATAAVPGRYGLAGPYCVCVGGDDWRKNMEATVRAFAHFRQRHADHRLAIVCKLSSERIAGLGRLAADLGLPPDAVVCTGYVSDEDLVGLVRHAGMLVYPSLYEGLGLPVLEAYGCGTPAVGSATSSIAELVIPELTCDPEDPAAIAAAMGRLAADPGLRERSLAFGRRLLTEELGWKRAAAAVMEHVEAGREPPRPMPPRPRIAVVAALPPARTGIAAYTLDYLQSDRWQTTFYDATPGPRPAADRLLPGNRVLPSEAFAAADLRGRHDAALFVLGNSPHHAGVLEALFRSRSAVPGDPRPRRLAYLHEAALESLFRAWLATDLGGMPGVDRPAGGLEQHPAWIVRALAAKPDLDRCLRLLAERAELDGIVVNSAACRDLVVAALGSLADRWTIDVAFLPVPAVAPAPRHAGPAAWDTAGPLMVGSFGMAGDTKRLDLLAGAAAVLRRRRPVRLVLAGWEVARAARRLGLSADQLETIDAPDDAALDAALRQVDVAVQLRWPTFGESSGVVARLLACGTPLVVTAAGSFAELPAAAAIGVAPDCDPATLATAIETAAARPVAAERRAELMTALSADAFARRLAAILAAAPLADPRCGPSPARVA